MVDRNTPPALRVAVVGAGYFAQQHHEAWRHVDGAVLVAVADRDRTRAESAGVQAFGDAGQMLAAIEADIIDIATPPETHLDLITQALAYGPKAVICQKPFCGDIDSARQAVSLAARADIPLVVHENFRFQPWYRALRDHLAAGRIGTVLQATFRLRPGDGQGPDAYLSRQPYFQKMPRFLVHETGIHWIDTFRFLLGEPDHVYADLRRLNPAIAGEDAGHILFGFNDGRRALFDANRLVDHAAQDPRRTMGECLVEGTQGSITLHGDGTLRLRAAGEGEELTLFKPNDTASFGGGCIQALQSHVVNTLRGERNFENEAVSYLRNMEIELDVYQSALEGRRLPLFR
jgi:predicted dehydrogenase